MIRGGVTALLVAAVLPACAGGSAPRAPTRATIPEMLAPAEIRSEMLPAMTALLGASVTETRVDLPVSRSLRRCAARREDVAVILRCGDATIRFEQLELALRAVNDGSIARDLVARDLRDPDALATVLEGCREAPVCRIGDDGLTMSIEAKPYGSLEATLFLPDGPRATLMADSVVELRELAHERAESLRAEALELRANASLLEGVQDLLSSLGDTREFTYADVRLGMPEKEAAAVVHGDFGHRGVDMATEVFRDRVHEVLMARPSHPRPEPFGLTAVDGEVVEITTRVAYTQVSPGQRCAVVATSLGERLGAVPTIAVLGPDSCGVTVERPSGTLTIVVSPFALELALRSPGYPRLVALRALALKELERRDRARKCDMCASVRPGQSVYRWYRVIRVDKKSCTMTVEAVSSGMSNSLPVGQRSEMACATNNEY